MVKTEQEIANEVLEDLVAEKRNGLIDRNYTKIVVDEFERIGIGCQKYKKYLSN